MSTKTGHRSVFNRGAFRGRSQTPAEQADLLGIIDVSYGGVEELAQFSSDQELLLKLAYDEPATHMYLAHNPHASEDVINEVWRVSAEQPGVARAVAYHQNTSEYVLRRAYLSKEAPPEYQALFVGHPATPAVVLEFACRDPYWPIREAVACHANATPEILEQLMNDPLERVAQLAANNPARHARPAKKGRWA